MRRKNGGRGWLVKESNTGGILRRGSDSLSLSSTWYLTEELLAVGRGPDPTRSPTHRKKQRAKGETPAGSQAGNEAPAAYLSVLQTL